MGLLLSLTNDQEMSTANALRFSNDESKQILSLANFRNQVIKDDSNKNILKSALPVFSNNAGEFLEDVVVDLPIKEKLSELDEFLGQEPTLFLAGGDLIKQFDLKPGPAIGELVRLQQDLWYENPAITKEEVHAEIQNNL